MLRPLVLLCLFCACEERALRGLDPVLTLELTTLDFGEVEVRDEQAKTLVLKNDGRRALTLSGWELTGQDAFTYTALPEKLEAGKSASFEVHFKPVHLGALAAQLQVRTNDKLQAHLTFTFSGTGIGSTAAEVGFGKVIAKLTRVRDVPAPSGVVKTELRASTQPECADVPAFRLSGEQVSFAPPCAGVYETTLRYMNDEGVIARAFLSGEALEDCTRVEETHRQRDPADNRVDVLFVIDDSGTAKDDQDVIAASAHAFFAELVAAKTDYHVAVTTTDFAARRGALLAVPGGARVVTPQAPAGLFGDLLAQVGTNGGSAEYGFASIASALTSTGGFFSDAGFAYGPGTADMDFLRADADFFAIIVSDADDATAHEFDVAKYILEMKGLSGFKTRAVAEPDERIGVFALVDPGIDSAQCGGEADNHGTPIYHSAISAMGASGRLISLCSDVRAEVARLGLTIAKPACTFPLAQLLTPDEPSELCVDGGACFSSADVTIEGGVARIAPALCPAGSALTYRMRYASCLRSHDADGDGVPDAMEEAP